MPDVCSLIIIDHFLCQPNQYFVHQCNGLSPTDTQIFLVYDEGSSPTLLQWHISDHSARRHCPAPWKAARLDCGGSSQAPEALQATVNGGEILHQLMVVNIPLFIGVQDGSTIDPRWCRIYSIHSRIWL